MLLPWSRWACNARSWAMLPFASVWKRVCLNVRVRSAEQWPSIKNESFLGSYICPCGSVYSRRIAIALYRAREVESLRFGIGPGLNLPFYASAATEIIGLEPSPKLLEMANKAAQKTPIPLRLVEGTAETIPIENHNVDAVVTTWTMCSIPEIQTALQEMRRVLRPRGRPFFVSTSKAIHCW